MQYDETKVLDAVKNKAKTLDRDDLEEYYVDSEMEQFASYSDEDEIAILLEHYS